MFLFLKSWIRFFGAALLPVVYCPVGPFYSLQASFITRLPPTWIHQKQFGGKIKPLYFYGMETPLPPPSHAHTNKGHHISKECLIWVCVGRPGGGVRRKEDRQRRQIRSGWGAGMPNLHCCSSERKHCTSTHTATPQSCWWHLQAAAGTALNAVCAETTV